MRIIGSCKAVPVTDKMPRTVSSSARTVRLTRSTASVLRKSDSVTAVCRVAAIGFIDVLFALDPLRSTASPASPIVFTANALALIRLRQLFFLLDGLLEKLVYSLTGCLSSWRSSA